MTQPSGKDIPIGDIKFYDDYAPALAAGNWRIRVDHSLEKDGAPVNTDSASDPLNTSQEFVVSAPQFSLIPSEIVNKYPPEGSSGIYGEVLPHVVFSDPLLPWERKMTGQERQPWLAVLVFPEGELVGGDPQKTQAIATTVGEFLKPQTGVVKGDIHKEDDVADTDPCSYIQIPVALFRAVAPRLTELRYLAHCRQINTGDKAVLGIDELGLFSVVVANRFPETPPADGGPEGAQARKNIVHLVSLEGLEPYLVDAPSFGSNQLVAVPSLASWSFQTLPDHDQDFRGLVEGLVTSETAGTVEPELLWLRLPQPAAGHSDEGKEMAKRLADGFVPLSYRARTGEETFAWYRGPLAPVRTTSLDKSGPFPTADAAIIYDEPFGVFDHSLASAWQIGRAVALSDKAFGQTLLDFRRRAHRMTDHLLHRLQSDHFSADQIAGLEHDSAIQDQFIELLDAQLLQDIGTPAAAPGPPPAAGGNGDTDPKTAVQNFLARPDVQALLTDLVKVDLDPISRWLARLLLLYPVPFDYLVADPRMLPIESLRFFYLDGNWTGALLDGALSIGMESSRQTFFHQVTHGVVHEAASEAARVYRDHLLGVDPTPPATGSAPVSGLLLRSALVSGWPNLAVRPRMNDDSILKVLRMDHLSPSVLLCLFDGVPDYVELSEPQEGFRFGTDDDGAIPLRNLVPASADLGQQLAGDPTFRVRDLGGAEAVFMRSATSRVLNLAPGSETGLVQALLKANSDHSPTPLTSLGPGDFALQMVKSPEAIRFISAAGP